MDFFSPFFFFFFFFFFPETGICLNKKLVRLTVEKQMKSRHFLGRRGKRLLHAESSCLKDSRPNSMRINAIKEVSGLNSRAQKTVRASGLRTRSTSKRKAHSCSSILAVESGFSIKKCKSDKTLNNCDPINEVVCQKLKVVDLKEETNHKRECDQMHAERQPKSQGKVADPENDFKDILISPIHNLGAVKDGETLKNRLPKEHTHSKSQPGRMYSHSVSLRLVYDKTMDSGSEIETTTSSFFAQEYDENKTFATDPDHSTHVSVFHRTQSSSDRKFSSEQLPSTCSDHRPNIRFQPTDLQYWGLPFDIVASYNKKGISSLYPWQAECLQKPGVTEVIRYLFFLLFFSVDGFNTIIINSNILFI